MGRDLTFTTIFVSLLFVCHANNWKDCTDGSKGKLNSVSVSGCDTSGANPCQLKKGTNETITVTFTSLEEATSIKAVVHGIVAHIPMPFPIANSNGCKSSGIKCPTLPNVDYTYHSTIFVKTSYPSLSVPVKWQLKDQNGGDIMCFIIKTQIVS